MAAGEGGAGSNGLKLVGVWPSPFVLRPGIALNLKGLDFELVEDNPREPKTDIISRCNPIYKKIPILIHNGESLCESMIIVQYLDDAFPDTAAVLPADPRHRALHRFWAVYVDDKWMPAVIGIMKAKTEEAKEEVVGQTLAGLDLLEEAHGKLAGGKPYFGGESIGYLDIALGSYLGWTKTVSEISGVVLLDEGRFPRISAWAERFCGHDAVKGIMPDTATLVEISKVLRARFEAEAAGAGGGN